MRAVFYLGMLCGLASCEAPTAVPEQVLGEVAFECGKHESDAKISTCLENQINRSSQRLENALKRNLGEATQADKERLEFEGDDSAIDPKIHVNGLKASQAAWEKYSDTHCTLESYTALRGTAQRHFYLRCLDRLNLQRLKDLRSPFILESQRLQPVPEE